MNIQRIWRTRSYFLRGHLSWFVIILNTLNFIVIQYALLIETNNLQYIFGNNILIFAIIFTSFYIPINVLIGYWDYKKGAYRTESALQFRSNPVTEQLQIGVQEIKSEIKKLGDEVHKLLRIEE